MKKQKTLEQRLAKLEAAVRYDSTDTPLYAWKEAYNGTKNGPAA